MFYRTVCGAMLVALLGTADASADENTLAAKMKKFEGSWQPVSVTKEGEPAPIELLKSFRMVIKGDKYENQLDGKTNSEGNWKFIAQNGTVFHMDITPTDGPQKGKKVMVIFEWKDDDTVQICGPSGGMGDRPTKFTGDKGSMQTLTVLKRVK